MKKYGVGEPIESVDDSAVPERDGDGNTPAETEAQGPRDEHTTSDEH